MESRRMGPSPSVEALLGAKIRLSNPQLWQEVRKACGKTRLHSTRMPSCCVLQPFNAAIRHELYNITWI